MEGKSDDLGEKSLAEKVRGGSQITFNESDKNDIPIQELVTSESKTPLKTPVREGDEDGQGKFNATDGVTEGKPQLFMFLNRTIPGNFNHTVA